MFADNNLTFNSGHNGSLTLNTYEHTILGS